MIDAAAVPALRTAVMPRLPEQQPLAPPSRDGWAARHWHLCLLLLAAATLLVRARYIGNPLIDADEQFYLLTGDRLLHGALPYVDIWDRKPVGLFVLYALIRLLGGDGVLQYQLVAAAFVIATTLLIARVARRIAGPVAALAAALSYPLSLALSGGQGGQTPVFYNLLVLAATALVLDRSAPAPAAPSPPRLGLRVTGALAMLLVGVAIQIKYNAVFEGIYFGLVLLLLAWRADPRPRALAASAAVWIAVALAPTLLAFLVYAAIGQADAFDFALRSIFARAAISPADVLHNLGHDLGRLLPYLVAIAIAEGVLRREVPWRTTREGVSAHRYLLGWAIAAALGFLIFGTYFNHYVLPLLAPLAILAAPAFSVPRRRLGALLGTLVVAGLGVWFLLYARRMEARNGTAPHAYEVAAQIRPLLRNGGCLFIFYGEPIYYQLTGSCLLTRWAFPYHLSLAREAASLGTDPIAEMHRILAQRPAAILDKDTLDAEINPVTQRILRGELLRNYRLVYRHRFEGRDREEERLWARVPGR